MAQAFRIETLDRSGRWYLTPGSRSIYDLRVRNDSKNAVDCSLVVEDPTAGVSVEPNAFPLRGHEVRTVTVTFTPEATSVRQHRILLSLHADEDGRLLATFEHPLVDTGGTDCSVAMAFKGAIIEAGELRGFEMTCSIRSQSEARSTFQVMLSPHLAFAIPELPALSLEPGQVGEVVIPIRWNRTVKDNNGWNHPAIFELAVPVSNGRRTSRMRWELIESKLEPFLKDSAGSANGAVASAQATVKTEPTAAPVPPPQPVAAPAANPKPVEAASAAPAANPKPVSAPAANKQPEPKPASVEPVKTATVIPMPAAPTTAPAAAASATTGVQAASPAATQSAPSRVAANPVAPLMLNGYVERLMLAAPIDAKPSAAPAVNGVAATDRVEVVKQPEVSKPSTNVAAAAPAASPPAVSQPTTVPKGEAIELSLFEAPAVPVTKPVAPQPNGKHESVSQKPPATVSEKVAEATTTPPATPAAPPQTAPAPAKAAQELALKPQSPAQPEAKQPAPAQVAPAQAAPAQPTAAQPTPALSAPTQPVATPTPPVTLSASAPPKSSEQPQAPLAKTVPQEVPPPAAPTTAATSAPTVQPALAPQWKIVSAAESIEAAAAQASAVPAPAPVAQAPVPSAPAAPAPTVATPVDANASAQTAPPPAPAGPPPKLTPYAPPKWDSAGEVAVPVQAARATSAPATTAAAADKVAAPIPVQAAAQTSAPARVVRERQTIEAAKRRPRPGLLIGGLAAVAIVIGIIIFKPSPQTHAPSATPVTVAPPVVAVNPTHAVQPAVVHPHVALKPKLVVKPTPSVAATSAPAATPKPATPSPATPALAKPKPAAQNAPVVATRPQAAPKHVARYGTLYRPVTGSTVALGGIEAFYGPRGRAVRVIWSAAEQASASVSLIDDRGTTVNSVNVRGGRQSVILYVPRGYHGGLTVQVSSIGRYGDRVAQTTSLPPFGY